MLLPSVRAIAAATISCSIGFLPGVRGQDPCAGASKIWADYDSSSCLCGAEAPPPVQTFSSVESCCAEGLNWVDPRFCSTRSAGTLSDGWVVDWDTETCVKDCDPALGPPCANPKHGSDNDDPSKKIYETVEACCGRLSWKTDCVASSDVAPPTPAAPTPPGAIKIWADYDSSSCKRGTEAPPPVQTFTSIESCCAEGLNWVDPRFCNTRSEGTLSGGWVVDWATQTCAKDCDPALGHPCANPRHGSHYADPSKEIYETVEACCARMSWATDCVALSDVAPPTPPTPPPTTTASPITTPPPTPCGPALLTVDDVSLLAVYRKAANHLEEMKGQADAPGWNDGTTLASSVVPFLRPDIAGPAYFEFKVNDASGSRAGFIFVSTGVHDLPIPHWNYEGQSPSEDLDALAPETIGRYYKLDSLAYAGESCNEILLANVGELPNAIDGITPELVAPVLADPEIAVGNFDSSLSPNNDTSFAPTPDPLATLAPSPSPLDTDDPSQYDETWTFTNSSGSLQDTWDQIKSTYSDAFEIPLATLADDAQEEWDILNALEENGEGLEPGDSYTVSLLYPLEWYKLSGEAVSRAEIEVVSDNDKIVLTAMSNSVADDLGFVLELKYTTGAMEMRNFAIISQDNIDTLNAAGTRSLGEVHWADHHRRLPTYSSWNSYKAGTDSDQRLYRQISKKSSPNTSNCASGCGATAWAMLFGWGDVKASQPGSGWNSRWGLYRQNGGYGANAVAPKFMSTAAVNTGVRRITWEIRKHIKTFCVFGSGATYPWRMSRARYYFYGRTGTKLSTSYNAVGIRTKSLRNKARDSIVNRRTPAVIGTGWLQHYPLAYGYRERKKYTKVAFWTVTTTQREFYVNQGWGGSSNGWINARTWFYGSIRPN